MEENKDKIEHMEYELKDEKTGEIKRYEISYSQKLQENIEKELKKGNRLKIAILVLGIIILGILILIQTKTGLIGWALREMICP